MPEARQYRLLGLIGEGGFGRVYRAELRTSDGFQKHVAIKLLKDREPDPDLLMRFRDEARILGLLRDRAIVSVDPPTQLGGYWAVVMDFVDGRSLAAIQKEAGIVPPGVAMEIVGEIARLLDMAQFFPGPDGQPLELLHRDIKPANIQITPSGDVRLLDFGVARASFSEREAITTQGITGTPGYMAPERLMGIEGPFGDVYGLGMVLWRLVTGERPGDRTAARVEAGIEEHSARDPHLREVLELAARMRDLDHEDRPTHREVERTCRELRQRLPEPWLREWAEHVRPHDMESDALVGTVLTARSMDTRLTGELPSGTSSTLLVAGSTLFLSAAGAASLVMGAVLLVVIATTTRRSPDTIQFAPPVLQNPQPDVSNAIRFAPVPRPEAPRPRRPDPTPTPTPPRPDPTPITAPELVVAPAARRFPITIRSVPWEARISLDGRSVGKTPMMGFEADEGTHTLTLEHGGATLTRQIDVGPQGSNDFAWRVAEGDAGWSQGRR
ncbi:MAG: serine/threonine protein kinase [Alphaproteobacteria bacterium]|nr:serine/threonine protein kinase [Alphaproteobacteria bacterium]